MVQAIIDWKPQLAAQTPGGAAMRRARGRPRARWEDNMNAYALSIGRSSWQQLFAEGQGIWQKHREKYVEFILADN